MRTFVEAGRSLQEIRDSRLYREQHPNFEAYCHTRWGFTRRRAGQIIEAYDSFKELAALGNLGSYSGDSELSQLPTTEKQMRALSAAPLEQRPQVWQRTVEATGGKPTAAAVKATAAALKARVGDEVLITADKHPHHQQAATIIDDTDGVFIAETDQGTTGLMSGQFEIIAKAEQPAAPKAAIPGRTMPPPKEAEPARPLTDWSRAELINRVEDLEALLRGILSSASATERQRVSIRAALKR